MAHFVLLVNGYVSDVNVINNSDLGDTEFPESEPLGQEFQKSLGFDGHWIQASYSGSFRGHYPSMGDFYDADLDVFVSPKPYESWVLDTRTGYWTPPFPTPDGSSGYVWDEEIRDWLMFSPPQARADAQV
jgi:hypothetical protein